MKCFEFIGERFKFHRSLAYQCEIEQMRRIPIFIVKAVRVVGC